MDSTKKSECQSCHRPFVLSEGQASVVDAALKKGQIFIVIECPLCGMATTYVPHEGASLVVEKEDPPYRCPVSHCAGWVSFVEEDASGFWGCGECGSIWRKEKNLQSEITNIISRYKYRCGCYMKKSDRWIPAPFSDEDSDYENLVESEPVDKGRKLVRG